MTISSPVHPPSDLDISPFLISKINQQTAQTIKPKKLSQFETDQQQRQCRFVSGLSSSSAAAACHGHGNGAPTLVPMIARIGLLLRKKTLIRYRAYVAGSWQFMKKTSKIPIICRLRSTGSDRSVLSSGLVMMKPRRERRLI